MEKFRIDNETLRERAIEAVRAIAIEDQMIVTITSGKAKRAQQRGLQWRWYTEVAQSGRGGSHEESKESVHRLMKWKYCVPILLRDDPDMFGVIYASFMATYGTEKEKVREFIDEWVSTEKLSCAQMAEYLTSVYTHYSNPEREIYLSDPDHRGLLDH